MRGPTLENVCCRLEALEAAIAAGGSLDVAALQTSVAALQAVYNVEEIHGAGTAYTLTGTAAAVDMGATDPVIVLGEAGRYLILATIKVEYAGATVVAETMTAKLRRTNNTAADITSTPVVIDLPVATTLTHTYGVIELPPVEYTTAEDDDSITIFANLSALLGAGNINISMADIIAIRLA